MEKATAQSALAARKNGLAPFLVGSLAVHGLVLGLFFLLNLFHRPRPLPLEQPPIKASLVRLGKPRDPKLLPRREQPLPPPNAEAAPPTPKPPLPAPPAVAIPVPGVKPTPAAPARKPEATATTDSRSRLFGAFSKVAQAAKPEALEGQAQGDPRGDAARSENDPYWGLLNAQVRQHYDVSQTIPDAERMILKALLQIRIGKDGKLLDSKLVVPSGNALFDNAVLTAVKRASPFSPPPGNLLKQLQGTGVTLEFTP